MRMTGKRVDGRLLVHQCLCRGGKPAFGVRHSTHAVIGRTQLKRPLVIFGHPCAHLFGIMGETLSEFFELGLDDRIAIGLIAIFFIIILMVLVCFAVMGNRLHNSCCMNADLGQIVDDLIGDLVLFERGVENGAAILRANIRSLLVQSC